MNKKGTIVAVTGATGFIGYHLVAKLKTAGYGIRVLLRKKDLSGKLLNTEVIVGDLVTGRGLEGFVSGADYLIHLAARQLPPEEEMFADNVVATKNLIDAALKSNIKKIVYLSTAAVYGESKEKIFNEDDLCFPNTRYGLTKYLSEQLVNYWAARTRGIATLLRPFNVYGPGSSKGVIYNFYQSLLKTGNVTIFGDGSQSRDFLYVDDLVIALVKTVEKNFAGIFNLGTGKNNSLVDVVKSMENVIGKKIETNFKEAEANKVTDLNYSTKKTQTILDWRSEISLEEGIRRTLNSYEGK